MIYLFKFTSFVSSWFSCCCCSRPQHSLKFFIFAKILLAILELPSVHPSPSFLVPNLHALRLDFSVLKCFGLSFLHSAFSHDAILEPFMYLLNVTHSIEKNLLSELTRGLESKSSPHSRQGVFLFIKPRFYGFGQLKLFALSVHVQQSN